MRNLRSMPKLPQLPGGRLLYRAVKLSAAMMAVAVRLVRCPCGGWDAAVLGGAAGTVLYIVLARSSPRWRAGLLARAATWSILLSATADEILWRSWVAAPSPAIPEPFVLPAVLLGVVGFALMHLPSQSLTGVATHLLTGAVFTASALVAGLWAAVAAHALYNLWVSAARMGTNEAL